MRKIKELFNLGGKTAIVTGGLGHLGFAMSEAVLELGAELIITTTKHEIENKEIKEKLDYLKENYKNVSEYIIDFADKQSIIKFFDSIKKADILVNNAYYGPTKNINEMEVEDFMDGLSGGLASVFLMSKLFFKKCNGKGNIINIGSMYGIVSPDYRIYKGNNFSSPPSYAAAKSGVIELTKYLASYWSEYGMRVNSISPGPFPKQSVTKDEKFYKALKDKTMLGRIGEPEDLKGVIAFLASDASSYVTGQNFIIDGGWTAW